MNCENVTISKKQYDRLNRRIKALEKHDVYYLADGLHGVVLKEETDIDYLEYVCPKQECTMYYYNGVIHKTDNYCFSDAQKEDLIKFADYLKRMCGIEPPQYNGEITAADLR